MDRIDTMKKEDLLAIIKEASGGSISIKNQDFLEG